MTHTPTVQQLLTAIAADNDDVAELYVLQLTSQDEAWLLPMTQSADVNEAWWAVRALAQVGSASAVPVLQQTLAQADPSLRTVAAMTLGQVYERAANAVYPALVDLANALADPNGIVRQTAADALAQIGNAALPFLAIVLKGEHEGARSRAAYALRKIRTMEAAALLFSCLNDSNYLVHTYAYEGLDELGLLENVLVMP